MTGTNRALSAAVLLVVLLLWAYFTSSAANALKDWVYEQPGMGEHTVNPVVGETNDARVNNMWADPVRRDAVFEALDNAAGGAVAEGSARSSLRAIPIDDLKRILEKHGVLGWDETQRP